MGTEILKSFGTLQTELEQAKNSLRGVDENIKRLIGRDPSEILPRPGVKRPLPAEENRGRQQRSSTITRVRNVSHENDEPSSKRRTNTSVFKRLSERPSHFEEEFTQQPHKQMISKVIVTAREVPSRQEALAAQNTDEKSKARNRRMFGALLGTLQKFQQEETKLKQKEEKRAQLEKKIEEHEIKEKAEIKKEKQELFLNRKKKQAEIRMIELKIMRMKELAFWEERQKPRMNFIQTKAKPHISYLPRKLNDSNKATLELCRTEIEKSIDKKRQDVYEELQHIEERMKKNFEPKKFKDEKQENFVENNEEHDDNKDEKLNGNTDYIADDTNKNYDSNLFMDTIENANDEDISVIDKKAEEETGDVNKNSQVSQDEKEVNPGDVEMFVKDIKSDFEQKQNTENDLYDTENIEKQ